MPTAVRSQRPSVAASASGRRGRTVILDAWAVGSPAAGSSEPLIVTVPAPLDHALFLRTVGVTRAGQPVDGVVEVSSEETEWRFTPRQPWQRAGYDLAVLSSLEDPAGNRIGRAFEVLPTDPAANIESPRAVHEADRNPIERSAVWCGEVQRADCAATRGRQVEKRRGGQGRGVGLGGPRLVLPEFPERRFSRVAKPEAAELATPKCETVQSYRPNVLHASGWPDCSPRRNHSTRCADEPCVKRSGETRFPDIFWMRSSPMAAAASSLLPHLRLRAFVSAALPAPRLPRSSPLEAPSRPTTGSPGWDWHAVPRAPEPPCPEASGRGGQSREPARRPARNRRGAANRRRVRDRNPDRCRPSIAWTVERPGRRLRESAGRVHGVGEQDELRALVARAEQLRPRVLIVVEHERHEVVDSRCLQVTRGLVDAWLFHRHATAATRSRASRRNPGP